MIQDRIKSTMAHKNLKILIVEDSREWQKYHLDLLNIYARDKSIELNIRVANSAREGLEIVQENLKNPFDIIFSDLQMETDFSPEFAGEWFVKQVKQIKEYQKTRIIIVSATYNIAFIGNKLGVEHLSKRVLINYPEAYYSILDNII